MLFFTLSNMHLHLLFDLLAYLVGAGLSFFFFRSPTKQTLSYYLSVIFGFVAGAVVFGSINTYLSLGTWGVSKSVIGALFGGIVAVESYKYLHKIEGSTGAYFVPSLAAGIMIGRVGCFYGGLDDFTYGIETQSFLGYDFGDGVMRHPVQLYESVLMGVFLIVSIMIYRKNRPFFERNIFYLFIFYYAFWRFFLEFLKPYADIVQGIDLFQILAVGMILYSLYYLRRVR